MALVPVLGQASASAGSTAVAVWLMDETSGTTMHDSSGHGNNGTTHHVAMTGANGYKFAAASRSKVVVPNSATLSPGASIMGTTNVTDGRPHTLTCTKTASGLTLEVDALKPRTKTVASKLGSISNGKALVIGAKSPTVTGTEADWYNGALLDARIRVG